MNRPSLVILVLSLGVSGYSGVAQADSCVSAARAELELKYPHAFGEGTTIRGPEGIPEIERKAQADIASCSHCPQKPFGYGYAEWKKFKSQIRNGDCIVFFRSDRASWDALMGVEGYALIRGRMIILEMLTSMS